jgi:hypothetical protein
MRAMNPVNSSSTTNRAIMPHLLNLTNTNLEKQKVKKETKPNQIVYKRAASPLTTSRPTHKTHSTLRHTGAAAAGLKAADLKVVFVGSPHAPGAHLRRSPVQV